MNKKSIHNIMSLTNVAFAGLGAAYLANKGFSYLEITIIAIPYMTVTYIAFKNYSFNED